MIKGLLLISSLQFKMGSTLFYTHLWYSEIITYYGRTIVTKKKFSLKALIRETLLSQTTIESSLLDRASMSGHCLTHYSWIPRTKPRAWHYKYSRKNYCIESNLLWFTQHNFYSLQKFQGNKIVWLLLRL